METRVFLEILIHPDDRRLEDALGRRAPLREEIRAFVRSRFGDRAVAAVETSGLPESLIMELQSAKKYAEGRGLRIEVKTKADVRVVLKLIEIKAAN
jgi:hypothetical protein